MKEEQLYLFDLECSEGDLAGVEGDGLCDGEEVYQGELTPLGWWQEKQVG